MTTKCHFSKNLFLSLSGIMFLLFWSAFNIGTALWGGKFQMDATTRGKYTLTQETLAWLQNNTHPLYVKLYVSENLENDFPLVAQNIRHIVFLLEQYKRYSKHLLRVEIIPVHPFTASEKEAEKQGIRPFMDELEQHRYYAGAVLGNDRGDSEVIPYFEPRRQNYLEHDFSRILSRLNNSVQKKIAIISPTLPLINTKQNLVAVNDWNFVQQLRKDYDIDYLPAELVEIPMKYDVVILINPQKMEKISKYALDQYLLYGGNVIIFMDPFSEMDMVINGEISGNRSNMTDFLASKGIAYSDDIIIGDVTAGMDALISLSDNNKVRQYPLWMQIQTPYINPESIITNGIAKLDVKTSGAFTITELANNKITTLYTSSDNAGEINSQTAKYSPKIFIKENFKNQKKRYRLGLLIEGNFTSLVDKHPLENSPLIQKYRPFVSISIKPGKLMLIGDSDMLANHNWNAAQTSQEQSIYDYIPYNNNMDFVEKIVDYMSNNQTLISSVPQDAFFGGQSLNDVIDKNVWMQYQQEFNEKRQALQMQKEELSLIEKQLYRNNLAPSVAISQKTTLLSHNITILQDQLNELLFKIGMEKQSIKRNIMVMNIIVFPSILLILVFITAYIFRRQKKQKAKEYAND